jgi:sensor histidine kinase YesM
MKFKAAYYVKVFLLIIVPFLVLTSFSIISYQKKVIEKELLYIDEKTRLAELQITEIFSEMDSIAKSVVINDQINDILEKPKSIVTYEGYQAYKTIDSFLKMSTVYTSYQYGITLVTPRYTYNSNAEYNAVLSMDSDIVTEGVNAKGGKVIRGDGKRISLIRSFYRKGKLLGVVIIDVNLSYIHKILEPFGESQDLIYILDGQGDIIFENEIAGSQSEMGTPFAQIKDDAGGKIKWNNRTYLMQSHRDLEDDISVIFLVEAAEVYRDSTRILIIFISYFVPFTILINIVIIRHNRKIEESKRQYEMKNLQTQVNPHMIYNTLNTITNLAQLQGVENIEEVSSSFAGLLKLISKSKGEFITLNDEIEYIRMYINIKKYNMLYDFTFDADISDEAGNAPILKLLLQPLVENSLNHGFTEISLQKKYRVFIKAEIKDNKMIIDIEDNGVGMSKEQLEHIHDKDRANGNTFLSVGVSNVYERLKLTYKNQAVFNVNSLEGEGTEIHMEYPV